MRKIHWCRDFNENAFRMFRTRFVDCAMERCSRLFTGSFLFFLFSCFHRSLLIDRHRNRYRYFRGSLESVDGIILRSGYLLCPILCHRFRRLFVLLITADEYDNVFLWFIDYGSSIVYREQLAFHYFIFFFLSCNFFLPLRVNSRRNWSRWFRRKSWIAWCYRSRTVVVSFLFSIRCHRSRRAFDSSNACNDGVPVWCIDYRQTHLSGAHLRQAIRSSAGQIGNGKGQSHRFSLVGARTKCDSGPSSLFAY